MTSNFYRAFEDRYRGSRELIKKRLEAYAPFTEILARIYPGAPTLDLGCGRGEWLELMSEQGFDASGVDLDEGMLAACMERGMQVKNADALSTLKELPDNSIAIVSAFHLVEHLPFAHVETLIAQALRVLRPGGLLIMETPNPENLIVGTNNFYLDPSHERPIPSLLLDFLVEFLGFPRRKVVRLAHEIQISENFVGLMQVAQQVSQDYGLVAQKAAGVEIMGAFNTPFDNSYGHSFIEMAEQFDAHWLRMRSETNDQLSALREELNKNEQEFGLLSKELAKSQLNQWLRMRSETNDQLSLMREEIIKNKQDIGLLSEELAKSQHNISVLNHALAEAKMASESLQHALNETRLATSAEIQILSETKIALTQMPESLNRRTQTSRTERILSILRRQRSRTRDESKPPARIRRLIPRRLASLMHTLLLHGSKSGKIRKVLMPLLNRHPKLRTKLLGLIKRDTESADRISDFSADWPTPLPLEYQYMPESSRKILLDLARTCGNSH